MPQITDSLQRQWREWASSSRSMTYHGAFRMGITQFDEGNYTQVTGYSRHVRYRIPGLIKDDAWHLWPASSLIWRLIIRCGGQYKPGLFHHFLNRIPKSRWGHSSSHECHACTLKPSSSRKLMTVWANCSWAQRCAFVLWSHWLIIRERCTSRGT